MLRRRCDQRFYWPTECDGPGTLVVLEFRCVLPLGHAGPHRVEEAGEHPGGCR